jgi:outer membrane protein assembly factor BamB
VNKTTVFVRRVFWTGVFCFLISRCVGQCADWPQFNGPNRDNVSTESGLLKEWPKEGPKLLWARPGFGEGFSSVAVSDGTIYTAGKVDADMVIFALDLKGEVKWKTTNGGGWSGSVRGTRCTPTVDGLHIYVMSGNGRVACLRAKDGGEVWAVNVKDKYEGKHGAWGYSESLLVDGDRVICTPGGSKALVLALDKTTGEEDWKTTGLDHPAGYVSPVAITHGGRRIVLAMSEKALVGVDAADGTLLWHQALSNAHGINAQTPLYHDGHVFISSGWDTGSVLMKLAEDGTAISEAWRNTQFDNDFGGILFKNECFYGFNWIGNTHGELMCVNFGSGETRYAKFTSDQQRKGAITWADGMLYGYDEAGVVWLAHANPEGFAVVSKFNLPEGSGEHWAHPVVSGGKLYVRHGDFLHAYDVKEKGAKEPGTQ